MLIILKLTSDQHCCIKSFEMKKLFKRTFKKHSSKSSINHPCEEKQASHPDSPKTSSSDPHSTTVNHFYNINNSSGIAIGKHSKVMGNNFKKTERPKQEEFFSEEDSSNLSEQNLPDWNTCKAILQVCSWIHEVNDENITRDIIAHLPDHILLNGEILPSDVFNMFYALRSSSKSHTIDVVGCDFTGVSLKLFSEELSSFNVKIQHFGLRWEKLNNEDFSAVVEISQHVEEKLMLWRCGITSCRVSSLAEKLGETGHKIQHLDLSFNKFGDQGFINLFLCLKNIQKLELSYCDISSVSCAEFAEKLIESGHKLEFLDLSGNKLIGDKGARSLIPCLHLIEELKLWRCNVTDAVEEEIRSELKRLGLPMDGVVFNSYLKARMKGDESSGESSDENSEEDSDENSEEDSDEMRSKMMQIGLLMGQTSASVGPGGCTLSTGRCRVVVPNGALEREVNITLTARYYGNDDTGRITPVLQCEPHGLEFKKSVEIILPTCFFSDEGESVTAMARQSKNGIDWETIKTFDHRMDRFFSFSTECFSFFDVIAKKFGFLIEKCFTCEVEKPMSSNFDLLYASCHIVDDIDGSGNNEGSPIKLNDTFLVRSSNERIKVSLSNNTMEIDPPESYWIDVRNSRWNSSFQLKKKTSSLLNKKVQIELSTANRSIFKNHIFTSSDHLLKSSASSSKTMDAEPKFKIDIGTGNVYVGDKATINAPDEAFLGESSNTAPEQLHKSNNQRRMLLNRENKSPLCKRQAEETDSDNDYNEEYIPSKETQLTTSRTNTNAMQNQFQPEGACATNAMSSQPGSSSAGTGEKHCNSSE